MLPAYPVPFPANRTGSSTARTKHRRSETGRALLTGASVSAGFVACTAANRLGS